jgi:hypothetical protein
VGFRSELNVPGWPGFRKVPWWLWITRLSSLRISIVSSVDQLLWRSYVICSEIITRQ